MRFFRFGPSGQEKPGAFDASGTGRDISSLIPDLAGEHLHPARLRALAGLDLAGLPAVDPAERLGACVSGVRNFIGVGLNYTDHAAANGVPIPVEPALFNKAPSCIVGPDDSIQLPPGSQKTDWEVELAVVIGAEAAYASEAATGDLIAGYCVCNDLSERSYQLERGGQWMKGKGCPTFGPLGPWLVTPDEAGDVQSLGMWLEVNGERVQSGSTATMIFSVRRLVSYASQFMTLRPGDVITTGSPPGVGHGLKPPRYLQAGDRLRLGIEGLGEQQQVVVSAQRVGRPSEGT